MSQKTSTFLSTRVSKAQPVSGLSPHVAKRCELTICPDPKVYVDGDGVIYDCSLNQSQIGKNANKFYRLQLLEDGKKKTTYHVHTRWGRVGEFGYTP